MMLVRYVYFLCLVFFVSVCLHQSVYSQCTSPINAFPYAEGFELNNGNWTRSSTAHWQWGAIIPGGKSVITAAANGSKCWIVGGLSGATYSGGNSFLTSPCFDFTSLTNPEISFQVLSPMNYSESSMLNLGKMFLKIKLKLINLIMKK